MLKHFSRPFLLPIVVWLVCRATAPIEAQTPPLDAPLKLIAQSSDAYIGYDATTNTWEIGTSGIRRRMDYRPGTGYRLIRLTNRLTGREWLAPGSGTSAELNMEIAGQTITGSAKDFVLLGYRTEIHRDGSLELIIALKHNPLVVHLHYVAFPGTTVLEQWAEIENTGKTSLPDLTRLDSISVALKPSAEPLTLYWVQGLAPPLETQNENQPEPILRLRSIKLDQGVFQSIGSRGRSSEEAMGWFTLAAPNLREGMFGGIEWSGDWELGAARDGDRTTLHAGLQGIRHTLAPGEIFRAPRRFIGFYRGDLDDAANESHHFVRTYLQRQLPVNFPWTQFNTWFAFYTNIDEIKLKREVDAAAELGLEVFVVDAGWYEKSPRRADFSFGLGTWRENPDKFPSGLRAFSDYVHSQGMKFGLWVEPERVDLDAIELGVDIQPEWLAPSTDIYASPPPNTARTANLCFGNPGARAWAKEWLTRIIREYNVDWLKWDNNVWMSCDPPHQAGDGNYLHVMGLYEILDDLRQEFPHLIIENCASGGHRMDYALLRRTDIAWLSDQTEPSYRVRYHITGASYPFPSAYLNSWLVESFFEHLASVENDPLTLRAWLRSRMMGAFGISTSVAGLSATLRTEIASEIERYKSYRSIIAQGKNYKLLPQNDLTEDVEPPEEPDAMQFYDPTAGKGIVFLFRGNVAWANRRVLIKGLDPTMRYEVTSADGTIAVRQTGRQLTTQSIRFQYTSDRPAALLFIQAMSPNPAANPQIPNFSP